MGHPRQRWVYTEFLCKKTSPLAFYPSQAATCGFSTQVAIHRLHVIESREVINLFEAGQNRPIMEAVCVA
jgi:hypothetical protein